MSIMTICWSAAGAMCFTLAFMHLLIWVQQRKAIAHLLFTVAAGAAGLNAFSELFGLQEESIDVYMIVFKLGHIPVALILNALVWFIVVYFGTARRWLAYTISALWVITLILNFTLPYSIVFAELPELTRVPLPWGEEFTRAKAVNSNLRWIPDLASLLIVIFVVDASVRLWRKGDTRRAVTVGGSVVFFMLAAGIHTPLVDEGAVPTPYLVSFTFLAIIIAMSVELSNDVIRTASLSKEVRANERRWRKLLDNVHLLVIALDENGKIQYVNPYYLEITGYSGSDIPGRFFQDLVPPDKRTQLIDLFARSKEGNILPHYQYTLQTKSRGERIVSWSNVSLHDRENNFIGTISVGADVTEREHALAEIERLKNQLLEENIYLQEEIILDHNHREIIGKSDELKYALSRVEQVAPTDTTVLIEGETGVGKELFARAVHHGSERKNRPLVKVNCAAIPENLIESELFGHVKGAFTGADRDRKGRFELADNGTIFLDEIGELPLALQPKLLRVLEGGELDRLGSNKTVTVNVRIITATNRDLKAEAEAGRFREDLYYRLSAFPISIPPLRKRRDDILPLVESLVDKFSRKQGKHIEKIPKHAQEMLLNYDWPGNVRELRNVIERAVISTTGEKLHLADTLNASEAAVSPDSGSNGAPLVSMEEMERSYIIKVLEACQWQIEGKHGACKVLDMAPSTLRNRMKKLGIEKPFLTARQ